MNYWLSPTGQAIAVHHGGHTERAIDFVFGRYEQEAFEAGIIDRIGLNTSKDIIGFLESKGWLRFQDWGKPGGEWIIHNRRPTKRQIEMMFELTGYFYKTDEQ